MQAKRSLEKLELIERQIKEVKELLEEETKGDKNIEKLKKFHTLKNNLQPHMLHLLAMDHVIQIFQQ